MIQCYSTKYILGSYTKNTKKIFISYSSLEYEIASKYREAFTARGISCWMAPESIPTGSNYAVEIPKAIQDCQVFVLILSDNSQNSIWVRKEIDLAVNLHKLIFPIKTGNYQLISPFNFYLTDVQMMQATEDAAQIAAKLDLLLDPDADPEPVQASSADNFGYTPPPPQPAAQPQPASAEQKKSLNKKSIAIIAAAAVVIVGAVGAGMLISSGKNDIAVNNTAPSAIAADTQVSTGNTVGEDGSYTLVIDAATTYVGTYTGDMTADRIPDGEGQFIGEKQDGTKVDYTGGFKNGVYYGKGTQTITYTSGDVNTNTGTFIDGKHNGKGKGTYTWANGDVSEFEANYSDDRWNGQCKETLTYANGDKEVFNGEYKNGKRDGHGYYTYTEANGKVTIYDGEYVGGRLNGQGKLSVMNTEIEIIRDGTFVEDQMNGQGKMTVKDAAGELVYEADFSTTFAAEKEDQLQLIRTALFQNMRVNMPMEIITVTENGKRLMPMVMFMNMRVNSKEENITVTASY